jgi:MoxR-like ATPase
MTKEDLEKAVSIPVNILNEVSKVVIGKEDIKELLLVSLMSGGHLLIEGLPGTAKTTISRVFAQAIGGEFKRIQFTPDMLPADITGFYLYSPDGNSRFVPGPIFANIVLADELNRATPRTHAALVEAMQENQVSVEGITHPLPSPFMAIASQLPYGGAGTYPLSEVQADRFLLRAWSGYPSQEEEKEIITNIDNIEERKVEPVTEPQEVLELRQVVKNIQLSEKVRDYSVSLVRHVRQNPDVLQSPSPRASITLYKASRALALLRQRDFVIPDDVKRLFLPALEHRIRIKPEAEMEEVTPRDIIEKALSEVPVPKEP